MREAGPPLLILGFGGHARSVGDLALACGRQRLLFLDPQAKKGESFAGFEAVAALPSKLTGTWAAFPAAGENRRRERQCAETPFVLTTLVAPSAGIGVEARLGVGTLVARNAHVGPLAEIGVGVILNTGCIVEHECVVGDFSHVSVNATLAGRGRIGRRVLVGAGAVVIDGISVCDDVVIGAGAVVVDDIDESGVYVGVPARRVGPTLLSDA